MKSQSCLLLFVCCFGLLLAEEHVDEEHHEATGVSNIHLPGAGDFAVSDGFLRAVGTAGALVTGIAGVAALLSFLLPMIGFRTCFLTGTCDTYADSAYSQANTNSVYDQAYTGYQYGNSAYRKRSLEYVGPILKALTAAYDKYGPKPRPVETAKST